MDGPCEPWVTIAEARQREPFDDAAAWPDGDVADVLAAASWLLWALSGRQYPGECRDTIRPCALGSTSPTWRRAELALSVSCDPCGRSSRSCACRGLSRLRLPGYPVREVEEVWLDGDELDPSVWRVDDWALLVRLDGSWPCCQDLRAEPSEPQTFEVTYTWGADPGPFGRRAVLRYATELAKADRGEKCSLPERTRSVVRQGLSIDILDPLEFLADGRTGVPLADQFIAAANPGRLVAPPALVVPGRPAPTRTDTLYPPPGS